MEFLILALEALKERKLRTSLTILMVIMGCSLIIAIDGLSNGTYYGINKEFEKLGTNLLIVTPRSGEFDIKDWVIDDIKRIDGVVDVVPFIQYTVVISARGKTQTVVVIGIDNSKLHLIFPQISFKEGTYVSSADSSGILLGNLVAYPSSEETFAELGLTVKLLYYRTLEDGSTKIFQKSFIVRGILDYYGGAVIPVDKAVFISLSAADSFLQRKGVYDGFYVITEDSSLNDMISSEIQDKYEVNIISPESIQKVVASVMSTISFFITSIAAVSLLVASVGIITTLYTSMMERIREIGILKAIGFRNSHILRLFLNEALIIGIVGGTIGLIGGTILAYILRDIFFEQAFFIYVIFTAESYIKTWFLAVGLSIVSGLYPAWRASKFDPVVALKYE